MKDKPNYRQASDHESSSMSWDSFAIFAKLIGKSLVGIEQTSEIKYVVQDPSQCGGEWIGGAKSGSGGIGLSE